MGEKYIIDRVEDDFVIIERENGDMYRVSIENINGCFHEGDILVNRDEYFEVDESFTLNKQRHIEHLTKNMWKE